MQYALIAIRSMSHYLVMFEVRSSEFMVIAVTADAPYQLPRIRCFWTSDMNQKLCKDSVKRTRKWPKTEEERKD